jgi:hypothetical protein
MKDDALAVLSLRQTDLQDKAGKNRKCDSVGLMKGFMRRAGTAVAGDAKQSSSMQQRNELLTDKRLLTMTAAS